MDSDTVFTGFLMLSVMLAIRAVRAWAALRCRANAPLGLGAWAVKLSAESALQPAQADSRPTAQVLSPERRLWLCLGVLTAMAKAREVAD
mmetsp:Transcript_41471/g.93559  ORF Transcript_41471/g.93559 Transcript_41471/m.93559 type:complete len:90 (-) Transcript_41471:32-301(-)